MNSSYMGEIERGLVSATIDSLEKIATAFGTIIEDLFRHLQPAYESRDNETLALLINRINGLSKENQRAMLDFMDVLHRWKQK